jgi:hypothetical protein
LQNEDYIDFFPIPFLHYIKLILGDIGRAFYPFPLYFKLIVIVVLLIGFFARAGLFFAIVQLNVTTTLAPGASFEFYFHSGGRK